MVRTLRTVFIVIGLAYFSAISQIPEHIQVDNEPVEFFDSIWTIALYIILPIVLIVGGVLLYKKRRKKS